MAISFVEDTIDYSGGTGVLTSTLNYTTATTGNLLLAIISVKPDTRSTTAPAAFFGAGGEFTGGFPTGAGGDVGRNKLLFWLRTADGSEPASDTLTWSGGSSVSPAISSMLEFSKTNAGPWGVAHAFGDDTTQATGADAIDAIANSDPGFQTGDLAVIALGVPTDSGTFTNPEIIIPGCTVGPAAPIADYGTSVGNDGGLLAWAAPIVSGSSSAVPQFQCDVDAPNASAGPVLFARLREPDSDPDALGDKLFFDGTEHRNVKLQRFDGTNWV